MFNKPDIRAGWPTKGHATLGEYQDKLRQLLTGLQAIHPIFRHLHDSGMRPNSTVAIAADLSNLETVMRKQAYDKRNWYSHMAADGLPALDSICNIGYSCILLSHPKDTPADCDANVQLSFNSGMGYGQGGGITIQFPATGAPEFYELAFQKKMFRVLIDVFQPDSALIWLLEFARAVGQQLYTEIDVGTIHYFTDPRIIAALPRDIEREPFGKGTLVIISREPPDPNNVKQVNDVIRVREALRARGLLEYVRADGITLPP
jgi:hypothetical protein